jgi:ADP-ribosylglycohydrolase
MESLCRGYDLDDLANTFCQWLFDARWTATGQVFDSGITTFTALERFRSGGCSAADCGCATGDDNGNGSLMRILPVAVFFRNLPSGQFLNRIHAVSAITHAHPRSKMGCGVYALLLREILNGCPKAGAYERAVDCAREYYDSHEDYRREMAPYERVLSGSIGSLADSDIASSGYVVDTLEASIWCFLRHGSTPEVLLAAVNLGLDTDTTGMVAGGLAGAAYGLDGIPEDWLVSLARREEIGQLLDEFVSVALAQ